MDSGVVQVGNVFNIDIEKVLESDKEIYKGLLHEDLDRYYEDFITEAQSIAWRSSKKKIGMEEKIVSINEASYKELVSLSEKARKERAKKLKTEYVGVTQVRGWIKFRTKSQYTPAKVYTQYIKLNEAKDINKFKEFKKKDIVSLLVEGNISVFCDCPDFLYKGYKFQAFQLDYGIFREDRFPKIRNPNLEGALCKHLLAVMTIYPKCWNKIASDMIKSKFFKARYKDDWGKKKKKKPGKKKSNRQTQK